jgi:hypothetical protein
VIWRSFADGVKRVVSAPAVLLGVFVLTGVMAVPLAVTLRGMLDEHLGSSLAADAAADGVNYDWWQEFRSQAQGVGVTFTPSVIGFAAVLDNVSSVLDREGEAAPIAGVLAVYLAAWTFLSGAIIDRFARQRATRAHGFFAAGGVFFFRFMRLAAIAGVVYAFLFGVVHGWLFDELFPALTRDVDVERTAFGWRLALYALFGALLLAANVVFDYARIRAVVEDRRSMLLALQASMRFVWRNAGRVLGLYAVNAAVWLVVIAVWALAAPSSGGAGALMWLGFVLTQVYVAARLFLKLQFVASQTSLFQASLAHAGYTAAPAAVWPESPSAELVAYDPGPDARIRAGG